MTADSNKEVLSSKSRRVTSVTLVAIGLLAALVAVLAWPAFDRIVLVGAGQSSIEEE